MRERQALEDKILAAGEGLAEFAIESWVEASELLEVLEPTGPSYFSFTLSNGDYVQCAGGNERLVVEARLDANQPNPKHFVFGVGELSGTPQCIECNVGPIYVDESQVLRIEDALLICREFIEKRGSLHTAYSVENVMERMQ